MKPLTEYPTPETDYFYANHTGEYSKKYPTPGHKMRELEQRLAACRDALEFYSDVSRYRAPLTGGLGDLYYDCGSIAKNALTSTKKP